MVRIWQMCMLLATTVIVCLAVSSSNGAPIPQMLSGNYIRVKRGIFGQLTSVTSTTTTAPRFKFGTTTKRLSATKKLSTTTKILFPTSTSPKSISETNEISTSSIPEITTVHRKETTEENEKISVSTSSPSPVYMNSSPSALMLHQSSEEPITFVNYDEHEQVIAVRHSIPPKNENLHKEEKSEVEAAKNRALSPSSIWNLIVVLFQLAYTVTQQKIPP